MRMRHAWGALLCMAAAVAQEERYADPYAFEERAPRTRLEKLVHRLLPGLVKVHGASGIRTIKAYATGVIVSEQGHVLTLDQVMLQRGKTRVVLHDGSVYPAELLPPDPRLGVRMLKIDAGGKKLTPLRPSTRRRIEHGTLVVSIGNAFRLAEFSEKMSATFGVVSAVARTGLRYRLADVDYAGELIITDAPNNPGSYGGGLFTLRGEWIGLNTRIVESKETNTQISAAIPCSDLVSYVRRTLGGLAPRAPAARVRSEERAAAWHGIVLFDHGGLRSPPAYVDRVERGSPARSAGLRPDDLVVRIDDDPVRSCKEFRAVMARHRPGDTVRVTFKRGRSVRTVELHLRERKR